MADRNSHFNEPTLGLELRNELAAAWGDFVAANSVGEHGAYANVSEYVGDLIRRGKERTDAEAFDRLKAELIHAFAAPEPSYQLLTAADIIARNKT